MATPRTFVRVQPTTDALSVDAVTTQFQRLHQLGRTNRADHGLHSLLPMEEPPTVECLLVSRGGADPDLEYYFGIDSPAGLDSLERLLRGLFPDSYEFDRHTVRVVDVLFDVPTDETTTEPRPERARTSEFHVAGVEFLACTERRTDWQTRLTSFEAFHADEAETRVPLAAAVETMVETPIPVVFQALLRPKPDWTREAEDRQHRLEVRRDTPAQRLYETFVGDAFEVESDRDERQQRTRPRRLGPDARHRYEEIDERDTRHSFEVNARAAAVATAPADRPVAEAAMEDLRTAFGGVSHTCYAIEGAPAVDDPGRRLRPNYAGQRLLDAIRSREFRRRMTTVRSSLPWTPTRRTAIVADPTEVPNFCVLSGAHLTAAAARALDVTPEEETAVPRPNPERLARYRGLGLTLGHPLTQDDIPDADPLALPPALQPMHVAWFGKTGSGKSTSLVTAMLDNHAATDGADILVDPKGDGMPVEYLRAHYARHGGLEDVYYFDCTETLPALSFFDVRDQLEAGIDRTTAVEDIVDHYVEVLVGIMGRERFERAVRSPDIIRYLVKALFDPVHGMDAFPHRTLQQAAKRMHDARDPPPVTDEDLAHMLGGVAANSKRSFDELMQGVANRIEKIPVDERLGRIFNHTPEVEGDPQFDFLDYLDENAVLVFDTGGLRSDAQRVLTIVLLSNLWTALKRRQRLADSSAAGGDSGLDTGGTDCPLVNLYVEEAASIAVSDLLGDLLAQARGFGLSVTLAMQYPAQLRYADEDAYAEVLNNVSTVVTGNVPIDRNLAERLATADMPPDAVGNRLRALRRGQWLANLPAGFNDPEPRPFLLESTTLPVGHPQGEYPLTPREEARFRAALADARNQTVERAGLAFESEAERANSTEEVQSGNDAPNRTAVRLDSALPFTKRLPGPVEYDESSHALHCARCGNRYDPSIAGMKRAIECCSSLADVDRDDIPVCEVNLKLAPEEREHSEYSDRQLLFLQAVYNAQQLRFDPLEYDLLSDSMLRLQEYVGIDSDAIQSLLDDDLLRHDADHPHRLYTVTAGGRDEIGESYRYGVDYGHGKGDLEESSQHVLAVEVGRRYLQREYVDDPDSSVTSVVPYYDLREGSLPASAFMSPDPEDAAEATDGFEHHRLDLAGLDDDGEIVVVAEAERVNHDVNTAVPEDYDKMAACDPEEAIWITMSHTEAHVVLDALKDPPDGDPRVEKTYSKSTPASEFRISRPGCTAMFTLEQLRELLLE